MDLTAALNAAVNVVERIHHGHWLVAPDGREFLRSVLGDVCAIVIILVSARVVGRWWKPPVSLLLLCP